MQMTDKSFHLGLLVQFQKKAESDKPIAWFPHKWQKQISGRF